MTLKTTFFSFPYCLYVYFCVFLTVWSHTCNVGKCDHYADDLRNTISAENLLTPSAFKQIMLSKL